MKARKKIREEAKDPANETAPERAREVRLATAPEKESVAARERDRRLRTVPTNDSEPASALLARLRAERAARDAVKKPRGRQAKEVA